MKLLKITRHRLHAAEDHLALALLTLQTGGENIRFQPKRTVFTVILRHQFFNVGQNRASSAITRLLPAPVGSTMAAGSW